MMQVVLFEKAEEKPETSVLVLFILPFQTGSLSNTAHKPAGSRCSRHLVQGFGI